MMAERGFWCYWRFRVRQSKFTHQKFTVFKGAWWRAVTICQNVFHEIFNKSVSVKISPVKFLHSVVFLHIICINKIVLECLHVQPNVQMQLSSLGSRTWTWRDIRNIWYACMYTHSLTTLLHILLSQTHSDTIISP